MAPSLQLLVFSNILVAANLVARKWYLWFQYAFQRATHEVGHRSMFMGHFPVSYEMPACAICSFLPTLLRQICTQVLSVMSVCDDLYPTRVGSFFHSVACLVNQNTIKVDKLL